ncbi:MAG: hypothetical protein RLZZ414_1160 [Bacteroidota bacterium]|jgi:hypothetical protein
MEIKNEIILYHSTELPQHIEVRVKENTVWLNRNQLADLFGRDVKTVGKHINNIFTEGELIKKQTVANFAIVQNEGDRIVERKIEFYNLDVIISVGYRVKSLQGTQFRIWATNVLRDLLLKGYAINDRFEKIENSYQSLYQEVKKISLQIQTHDLPKQGIFFEGEIFDAYIFVSNIIKKATNDIILIDNYIDETVLTLLTKRNEKTTATIYTKNITKQLLQDLEKHNSQYPEISIKQLFNSHDRFLIIDKQELYHLGASLKDLGKKWFAFSKMDHFVNDVLGKLNDAK